MGKISRKIILENNFRALISPQILKAILKLREDLASLVNSRANSSARIYASLRRLQVSSWGIILRGKLAFIHGLHLGC